MNKKYTLILIVSLIMVIFSTIKVFSTETQSQSEVKETKKTNQEQSKAIRCYNCPNNCLIELNKTGACGRYKNINGQLVPVK